MSNIQPQMTMAVRAGIAHAISRPTVTASRISVPSRVSSSATSIPITIVRVTFTAQNAMLRPRTFQNVGSVRTAR